MAIKSLAIVVTYSLSMLIKKIDTKVLKLIPCLRVHHTRADRERLYIKLRSL